MSAAKVSSSVCTGGRTRDEIVPRTRKLATTNDEKEQFMLILPELAEKVRRERHHESNHGWQYSSRRRSRRDRLRSRSSCSSNKAKSSGSSSTESTSRSITSSEQSSSDPVMDELQEKMARMQSPTKSSSSRRHSSSSRRRSTTSHRRTSNSRVGNSLSPRRRGSSSASSTRSFSNHQSEAIEMSSPRPRHSGERSRRSRSSTSHSPDNNNSSRRRRHHGGQRSSTRRSSSQNSSSESVGSLDLEDLVVPVGALRVDSIGQISVLSTSFHGSGSIPSEVSMGSDDHIDDGNNDSTTVVLENEDDGSQSSGTTRSMSRSNSCSLRSNLRSICEDQEEPMVEAVFAQNYEDELEQAREQGRREALRRAGGTNEIAVAVAANDRPSLSSRVDGDDEEEDDQTVDGKRKRTLLCYVALLCCIIIAIGSIGTLLFLNGSDTSDVSFVSDLEDEDDQSNLKAVIIYDPPTVEECQAIANGTMLDGQLSSLIQRTFDVQIELTLASQADFSALLNDLIGHIQQKLIPIMAGCQGINLFDATMAISDKLGNSTTTTPGNAITNGKVQEGSQQTCEGTDSIENCRVYVLVLDLYLEEEESNAILLEIIGENFVGEELTRTLSALHPTVQTASVPLIAPSSDIIHGGGDDVTSVPSDVPLLPETPSPTQSPVQDDSTPTPTAPMGAAATGVPLTPPTHVPSMVIVVPTDEDSIALGPTRAPTSETITSSPSNATPVTVPTATPTRIPTAAPSSTPTTVSPTTSPVPPISKATSSPVSNPTTRPVPAATPPPTDEPSLGPSIMVTTSMPSKSPTLSPVVGPTEDPSGAPTKAPSRYPSARPSKSPTTAPSKSTTASPSKSPTTAPSKSPTTSPSKSPTKSPSESPTDAPSQSPTKQASPGLTPAVGTFCCSKNFITCGGVNPSCQASQSACSSCNNAAWIEEGTCTTGLGWNDECTNNPSGCCGGSCVTVGNKKRCRA